MLNPEAKSTVVFCRGCLTFVEAQLGNMAYTAGDPGRALAHFEAAEKDCRVAKHGPELAWICYDYANLLIEVARSSDAEHALALLKEGAALASRHGMQPLKEKFTVLEELSSIRPMPPGGLTPREIDVLRLVAKGKTNKEIAAELFIAERTASNHVSNILAKTGCTNRGEAGAWAHQHGLVKP
jgi:DNA-binding CsgD family transcriptional regulator